MEKLYDRIDFRNNLTPALNETNLDLVSKALDDLDDRVIQVANMIGRNTEVIANPPDYAYNDLKKIKIDGATYKIPSGGGSSEDCTNNEYFKMYQRLGYLERHPITLLNPSDTFWIDVPEGAEELCVFGNNVVEYGNRFFTVIKKSKSGFMDYTQISNIPAQIYVKNYVQIGITEVNRMDIVNYYAFNKTDKLTSTTSTSPIVAKGNIRSLKMVGSSRKSINLFKPTLTNAYTSNGVTITPLGDGTYKVNGTASASTWLQLGEYTAKANQPIKVMGCPSGGSRTSYFLYWLGIQDYDYGDGVIITPTTEQTKLVDIVIMSGQTVNNLIFKPMITTDTSKTIADYEPYGIISASGDVVTHSENLLDLSKNLHLTLGSNVFATDNTSSSFVAKLEENSTYCFSGDLSKVNSNLVRVCLCNEYPSVGIPYTRIDNMTSGSTFTNTSFKYALLIFSAVASYNEDYKWMLNKGNTPIDYVSGIPTKVHTDRPLLSVNTLKNELIVNADGSGTFVERVKEVDLGSLNWILHSDNIFRADISDIKEPTNNMLTPNYNVIDSSVTTSSMSDKSIKSNFNNNTQRVFVRDSAYTDATTFTNVMNGKKLIYELATPTTYTLSPSEVAELLSLKTFGKTYIECDTEYEIGYFLDNDIASPIADVDSKVDGVASVVANVQSKIDELNITSTSAITSKCTSNFGTINYALMTRLGVAKKIYLEFTASQQVPAWGVLANIPTEALPSTDQAISIKVGSNNVRGFIGINGTITVASPITNGSVAVIDTVFI